MYVRNYKGKIIFLDENKYTNEKDFYIALWKIKYNINIAKTYDINSIIDYVKGDKICI